MYMNLDVGMTVISKSPGTREEALFFCMTFQGTKGGWETSLHSQPPSWDLMVPALP
jgi:hypothetical protein